MPNFPDVGYSPDHLLFLDIVEPTTITHPLPLTGQNPWDETFRLWAGDVESSVQQLESTVAEMFGPGIDRIEYITRTAYDLLSPPAATTLYAINEAL